MKRIAGLSIIAVAVVVVAIIDNMEPEQLFLATVLTVGMFLGSLTLLVVMLLAVRAMVQRERTPQPTPQAQPPVIIMTDRGQLMDRPQAMTVPAKSRTWVSAK